MSDTISLNLGIDQSEASGNPQVPRNEGNNVLQLQKNRENPTDAFDINKDDTLDEFLSSINTECLDVMDGNENVVQRNQVSVQNITSNSHPMAFMPMPNITNYGQITFNYNIKN